MSVELRDLEAGATRVRIRDVRGHHLGTVSAIRADGTVIVEWDRGLFEHIGVGELEPAPALPDYPILADIWPWSEN